MCVFYTSFAPARTRVVRTMDKSGPGCYRPALLNSDERQRRGWTLPALRGFGGPLVQIFVRDNNVDQALKALKKKMQREGSFREMKRHVHYEKPSEKRARQKAEAVRRARKLARKRAQREGLIAAPKKPAPR
jgi:small subunit ribosomal protein S21